MGSNKPIIPEGFEIETQSQLPAGFQIESTPRMSNATISTYKPPSVIDNFKNALKWVAETPRIAYQEGKQNVELAELSTKEMFLGLNNDEKLRLQYLNEQEGNNFNIRQRTFIDKNASNFFDRASDFAKKGYVEAFRMLPMTVATLKEGGIGYGIGGAIGAGIALVGGNAGAQAAVPEEIVTVPALTMAGAQLGGGWGGRIGAAKKVFELEAGFAREELKGIVDENGKPLDPVVLNGLSIGAGVINASLEFYGLKLMLKTVPGGEKILQQITKESIKDLAKNKVMREALTDVALKYAQGVAGETTTEMAQEVSVIVATEIAKSLQGDNTTIEGKIKRNVGRVLETGIATLGAMLYTGGVGSAAQTTNILVKNGMSEVQAKKVAAEMTSEKRHEIVEQNFDKLLPDSQKVQFAEDRTVLQGGVTFNKYKEELERQGGSAEYAEQAAMLIEQAHNAIIDKFGEEGRDHLEKSNLQIIIDQNNNDQLVREKAFVDIDLKDRNMQEFSPDELQTDAKTFQYKENSDEHGVTERLKDVQEYDPLFAGMVIAYEAKDGQKYIVDGHQRLGLAKRLNDPNIKLKGYLFKEADGYTKEQVRVLAAQKNIAEGSGTAIDTAKIIKEIGLKNLPKSLPQKSAMVQDGIALSKLGNEAFQKVVNGEVTPAQGARIAENIRADHTKQSLAIDAVRIKKLDNLEQVAMLAREIAMSDTTESEQTNLFGTEQIFESTVFEKIKIVDTAMKQLKNDKKIFNGLLRNQNKIQTKGENKLDNKTNEQIKNEAAVAIDLIEKLASRVGIISEKANELAQQLKNEEISLNQAVSEFRDFVTSKEVFDEIWGKNKDKIEYSQSDRGKFNIDDNGNAIIRILESGDASTLVHELGHFYLYSVEALSEKNQRAAKELAEINNWLGKVKDQKYTQEEITDFHEKFARGFEAYLMNGQAPTAKMKRAFDTFKDWLRQVYKSFSDLDIEMSEDTMRLFERVFTTDKEYEKEVLPKYTYNYELALRIENERKQPLYRLKENLHNAGSFISDWYDKFIIPVDTRLAQFSPELKQKLRNHTAALGLMLGKDYKTAEAFLKATDKMRKASRVDYETLDLALKNRDDYTVKRLADKHNFREEFEAVRDILEDIYTQALEVGIDIGYLEHYYPRMVKFGMTDKFLAYIDMLEAQEAIDVKNQVLNFEDANISRVLRDLADNDSSKFWSAEDRAKFINNRIRGFGKNNILLSRNGNLKFERCIDELDGNFNRYYEPFETALVSYITNSRKVIESRKLFGAEQKEVSDLRNKIKNKNKTLSEVEARTPSQAKYKEIKRLKHELSPTEINIESIEKWENRSLEQEEYLIQLHNKRDRLQQQIDWAEETNPFEVKSVVKNRLKYDIQEASKKISDIIGDSDNVENSIGAFILALSENNDIHAKDETVIREILSARFNAAKISDPAKIARDLTYIATLNDITNAIVQFGDLAFAAYKYGFKNMFTGMKKPFDINIKDLGLNDIAYEFSNPSVLSKWLRKQFELIGLSAIDGFGKNTIIQSALLDAQKRIKKSDELIDQKLAAIFGNENVGQVKADILAGKTTDDTITFAYHELADIQPISEDQMPELYHSSGSWMRLLYTLKTYGIKALDVARNNITMKIQNGIKTNNKKETVQGLKNLVNLQMCLWILGVPIDALRDLISNRDFNIFESLIDTLIPAFLMNRYMFRTADKEGVGAAVVDFFTPTIASVIEKTGKTYGITNIPFVGKPIYNWMIKEQK